MGFRTFVPVLVCLVLALVLRPQAVGAKPPWESPRKTTEEGPSRSPVLALSISLAATGMFTFMGISMMDSRDSQESTAGLALLIFGVGVGPSAGHIYTFDWQQALWPSLIRTASFGLMIYGFAYAIGAAMSDQSDDDWASVAIGLGFMGAIGTGSLTLYSIIDSPFSAIRFNKKHQQKSLSFSPLIIPPPPTAKTEPPAFGISLSGRF